jgi:uncharacterized protein with gpF-like domain
MSRNTEKPEKLKSSFAWKEPWTFADMAKEREQLDGFAPSRKAEREYERKLRSVAAQIKNTLSTAPPKAAEELLRKYAAVIEPWAKQSAANMVLLSNRKNVKIWQAAAKQAGVDMRRLIDSPGIGEAVRERIAENVKLITSLPRSAADSVAKLAAESLITGTRAEDIAKKIHKLGEISDYRARMIAHTEVSKATTALTKARAESIQSKGYIWRTARCSPHARG